MTHCGHFQPDPSYGSVIFCSAALSAGPFISSAVNPRPGHSTPGGASPEESRRAESSP